MLQLLLLIFALSQAVTDTNVAVDNVILNLKKAIHDTGLNQIPIGNIFYHWKYHLMPGTIRCNKGVVESLESLYRVSDVKIVTQGRGKVLNISLSLESLEFGYERCEVNVIHLIKWNGRVRASVETNMLKAVVTIKRIAEVCTTKLDDIHFTNIGKITVTTGGSIAHGMQLKVAQQVSEQMNKDIVGRINEKLKAVGSLVFANSNLCSVDG